MDGQAKDFWALGKHDDLLSRWPKDEYGQPEEAAYLATVADAGGLGEMTVAQLEAYGIPVLKSYPGGGGAGRIILGFSGYGAELRVPISRLEEAQALLQDAELTEEELAALEADEEE